VVTDGSAPATTTNATTEIDADAPGGKDVKVPKQFDYYSDGTDDE
jgi:hypothetical protein